MSHITIGNMDLHVADNNLHIWGLPGGGSIAVSFSLSNPKDAAAICELVRRPVKHKLGGLSAESENYELHLEYDGKSRNLMVVSNSVCIILTDTAEQFKEFASWLEVECGLKAAA